MTRIPPCHNCLYEYNKKEREKGRLGRLGDEGTERLRDGETEGLRDEETEGLRDEATEGLRDSNFNPRNSHKGHDQQA